MKTIDIYYSSVCGLCTKAIEYFHSRGVTFTAYAIEYDAATDAFIDSANTRTMYERCGEQVEFVPQIFIDDQYIGGWQKLEPLIESGEIDQLI